MQVKQEYTKIVRAIVFVRPILSLITPKNTPPKRSAHEKSRQSHVFVELALASVGRGTKQIGHHFPLRGNEDLPFENIEHPTQGSNHQHEPLIARDAVIPALRRLSDVHQACIGQVANLPF
jgi:hypothetical protein